MALLQGTVTIADAGYLSARPLPEAPDGRYDYEVKPLTGTIAESDPHSDLYKTTHSVGDTLKNAPVFVKDLLDPKTYQGLVETLFNKDAIDDRTGIFCKSLALLCRLPQDSPEYKALNTQVIGLLYDTLPHPPLTYVGADIEGTAPAAGPSASGPAPPRLPWAARNTNGTGNNPNQPELGRSRAPYARSVQSTHPLPPSILPSPEDVFDSLLKARDFKPHPGGNSSLTFSFASLVTHTLFRTDGRDPTKNNTTSYIDLSILYGTTEEDLNTVRDKAQGRGLLYPDVFAEDRLLFVPPAAPALLLLFNRNHNYIAGMLLKLNERGRWVDPPPEDPVARARQDEEIFQTARNVNCGNLMAMVFGDYVAGFLGLQRDGISGNMSPFDLLKTSDGKEVGRGLGNHCSVEFNLLYRWHAVTAKEDIAWTEDLFARAFKDTGKAVDKLTLQDFVPSILKTIGSVDADPRKRTFGGLTRQADGTFADDDVARVLHDATEKAAGAYRGRGSPGVLRLVECLGITQARQWGVCTMNEFRVFLGLKKFETFEEWNPDPEIANAARKLYGHIDNLELYPGLQAEETMPLGPASGLCCGYTMTRAILADAIALIRGDRFYTTDYTPANLTAWGFQDCARDPNNGAFGAVLPKLLARALPRHYPPNNVYSLFPFFTPTTTQKNLTNLHVAKSYDTARPIAQPVPKVISTLADITTILKDRTNYRVYESVMFKETAAKFSALTNVTDQRQAALSQSLFPTKDAVASHAQWLGDRVRQLVQEHSFNLDGVPGARLDVVGNVVNLAPVYWVSEFILGVPLKTIGKPNGLLTPVEVSDMLQSVFNAVYWENDWSTCQRASYLAQVLSQFIEKSLGEAVPHIGLDTITSLLWKSHEPSHDFLKQLATSKAPHDQLVADILGFAVTSAKGLSKTVAQVVDFYLDAAHAKEHAEVVRLACAKDAASRESLRGYVREAQRLAPQFAAVLRQDARDTSAGPKQMYVLDLKTALVNPTDFPDPLTVNTGRPAASYATMQEASFYRCLGTAAAEECVLEMVKAVFQVPGMERVLGNPGTVGRVFLAKFGVNFDMYTDELGLPGYWPTSLIVTHDA